MATESAVTIAGSHPFSTGDDTCLVHNGSLSNHNRLREQLVRQRRALPDRQRQRGRGRLSRLAHARGRHAARARWRTACSDLDGFYTFVVGTRDGFAVMRDPIACKPAVMAETDDWVAMASEYRALAPLPGVEHATHLGAGARDRLCLEPRRVMAQLRRTSRIGAIPCSISRRCRCAR